MKLDKAYFDRIHPETVRGKFYKKQEIDSIISEIGINCELMQKENELLQLKLENAVKLLKEQDSRKEGTRLVAQGLIDEAKTEAEKYISDANEAAELILRNANSRAATIISDAEEEKQEIICGINEGKNWLLQSIENCVKGFMETLAEPAEECEGTGLPADMGDRLEDILARMDELE